jgi:tetratricopeptide (TPR) repeat protein
MSITCQPPDVTAGKLATTPVDPKIVQLRLEVQHLQNQVTQLQGGGNGGLQIGKTAGEGNALVAKGRYIDAEAKYKEALALIPQRVARNELTEKAAAILQAHVLTKMGILYTSKKEYSTAESKFEEAAKLFGANPVDSPVAHKHFIECLRAYAFLLRAMEQPDKADEIDECADNIKL